MDLSVLYVIISTFSTTILVVGETGSDVNSLLTDIYATRGYNKKIRPITDQTDVLLIHMDFFLNSVVDFDEKTESLKTVGYLGVQWNDEYFTWTPASFNNMTRVFVPQNDIWKPDITLKNSYKTVPGFGYSELNVEVFNNGTVSWFPFQVFESTCPVSITYFPFDVQVCKLKFSVWSYKKTHVAITIGGKGIRTDEYVPSASWDLLDTTTYEEILSDEAAVIFTVKLKRKPRFFIINIIIPVFFLSILNVFSFVLPVVSGERAGYSITVFLSLAVFLTIVSDQLPNNSENTSIMAVYLMLITGLSTAIVMLCMIQLRLQSWNDAQKPVTKFYRNFVTVRNFFLRRQRNKQTVVPNDQMSSAPNLKDDNNVRSIVPRSGGDSIEQSSVTRSGDVISEPSAVTWLDVVNAMDFIFCLVSFVYTFTCTLVIGAVLVNIRH